MRLLSLTVRNYRIHKEFTADFDHRRTLIGGPNESGKSTLAEAAHRILFLRAKTGGTVQKEMTSSRHNGDPEVILTFEANGSCWDLKKRFAGANKGFTRLTAHGGASLRDDDAEAKLSELLKAETTGGRGAAGQLLDLWSHLWVWQGRAGEEPSTHTAQQKENLIRHLQRHNASTVLLSVNDQHVASRIGDTYAELFTAGGKAKAGSKPELARIRLEEAAAALTKASDTANRFAQAADDAEQAEREINEINARLPRLRQDRTAAETKLNQVNDLRKEEAIHRQGTQTAATRRKELEDHDRKIRDLQAQLAEKTNALQPAEAQLAALAEAEQTARNASEAAEDLLKKKNDALRLARLHHDLATAALTAIEKAKAHQALAARANEAAALQADLTTLRAELAKLPILTAADLSGLRKLQTSLTQAEATLNAMATNVELIEATVPVHLDGRSITTKECHVLTDSAELQIGDVARLRIVPGGGSSLADARQNAAIAHHALTVALQKFSLCDVEHATVALEQRQSLEPKITGIEGRWKALGGVTMAADLTQAALEKVTAHEQLQRRIALSPEFAAFIPPSDLASARELITTTREGIAATESSETTARKHAALLQEKWKTAAGNLTCHRDDTAAANQSLRDLVITIKTREETHGDESTRTQEIEKAGDAAARVAAQLTATQEALTALQPELLVADLDRLTRVLTNQEVRLRETQNLRLLAYDRLALDGSIDPEAELRFAEARHRTAQETYESESRRAKAIAMLHELFTNSRESIDRALVKPLADRITGYLQCVFGPSALARVELTENGIERLELIRADDPAFSFATLSGGTKEQVAAAIRLALAEILAVDHDGCLPIVFDDAFAYSDPDRIQSLQRMLDLASGRGLQVIVLTCTPGDYASFGAREIRIQQSC